MAAPSLPRAISGPAEQPFCRQFIAITPRSGSTWWCDLLTRAGMGSPAEFLNGGGLWRKSRPPGAVPASWSDLHKVMARQAGAEAYDLKASWFQFEPLLAPLLQETLCTEGFPQTVWSYLMRRDLPAQALSLYLMRRVGSAHSHKGRAMPSFDETWFIPSRANLDGLMCWVLHIVQQEYGWETFFSRHAIQPWRCAYEDLSAQPLWCLRHYTRRVAQSAKDRRADIENPVLQARRAVRRSRVIKRQYPLAPTEALLTAFRQRFSGEFEIIGEWRGKEPATAIQRRCALRNLDRREMEGL